MSNIIKISLGCFLFFLVTQSYAITVNVRSTSHKITGLGFTVNGEKHGGMGDSYHASHMPKGSYTFGLRAHGSDIGCVDKDGKKTIQLTKSTNAILHLKGRRCTMEINSK
jgi:hypothetical protein